MAIARNVDGDEVRSLRLQGWSLNKIAEELRISQSSVRHHCRGLVVKVPTQKREYRRVNMSDGEPLPPSVDLAYLIGVICGDGSISQLPRTCQLAISCDARYPELIETYVQLITKLLNRPASVDVNSRGTCMQVRTSGKAIPKMLGLRVGAKQQDYPIPEWIFGDLNYVRPFIKGLIETDGNVYHEFRNKGWCSRCLFTSKNASITSAFMRGTALLGYSFRLVPQQYQMRLTITREVHRLAKELDLKKERVYIQKGQVSTVRPIFET